MPAFTKKTVDKYIRNRMMYWIYSMGNDAKVHLKEQLGLSGEDELTDSDREAINKFQQQVRDDLIITGGCFTSMLQGEIPNDLDIYLRTQETARLISLLYLNKAIEFGELKLDSQVHQLEVSNTSDGVHIMIRSQGITGEGIDTDQYRYFEAYPEAAVDAFFANYHKMAAKKVEDGRTYNVKFMTSNAITLNNGLQVIIRFTGEPETIHSNFDFIHATNYWTWEEGVVYNVDALTATAEKRLRYFGSKFPVATIFRLKKFVERGWRISAGDMVKIMYDVSKLDLDSPSVLRDQSMGMDSAYFSQVIEKLHNNKSGDALDRTYLFKIINEVFDMHDPQDSFLERSTWIAPEIDENALEIDIEAI